MNIKLQTLINYIHSIEILNDKKIKDKNQMIFELIINSTN